LARITAWPRLNGSINVRAIAEAAGIPTQSLSKHPAIREALERAQTRVGVQRWAERKASCPTRDNVDTPKRSAGDGKIQRLEKLLADLEQQYSVAAAETDALRQQRKALRLQLAREALMMETGRRVAAPKAQ